MTNVISKKIPHSAIPFARISDVQTKNVVMQMNENMQSLKTQLEIVQRAIIELQGKA